MRWYRKPASATASSSPTAWASGKLDLYWPQPGPISGWHPTTYTVTVRLQDIQTHHGQPFYRKMAYMYVNRRGITKFLQFEFSVRPGGSVPDARASKSNSRIVVFTAT